MDHVFTPMSNFNTAGFDYDADILSSQKTPDVSLISSAPPDTPLTPYLVKHEYMGMPKDPFSMLDVDAPLMPPAEDEVKGEVAGIMATALGEEQPHTHTPASTPATPFVETEPSTPLPVVDVQMLSQCNPSIVIVNDKGEVAEKRPEPKQKKEKKKKKKKSAKSTKSAKSVDHHHHHHHHHHNKRKVTEVDAGETKSKPTTVPRPLKRLRKAAPEDRPFVAGKTLGNTIAINKHEDDMCALIDKTVGKKMLDMNSIPRAPPHYMAMLKDGCVTPITAHLTFLVGEALVWAERNGHDTVQAEDVVSALSTIPTELRLQSSHEEAMKDYWSPTKMEQHMKHLEKHSRDQ